MIRKNCDKIINDLLKKITGGENRKQIMEPVWMNEQKTSGIKLSRRYSKRHAIGGRI